jgi:hypothetical protein
MVFSLVVNDFGVKYVGKEHAQHLLKMVEKYYKCLSEWEGEQYCGLTLKWDYDRCKVHLLMPTYVKNALDKARNKFIQEVMGVFLFLAQAVDLTMLTPLSALASEQVAPTEQTMQKCLQFLDYTASQDDAIVTSQASDMKLAIHSNALYLSKPKAHSRAGGHMFMAGTEDIPINNGAVLNIS